MGQLAIVERGSCGLAWPYLLRDIPTDLTRGATALKDVTSVYGYPGPIAWGCAPGEPFLEAAWRELVDLWREQRVVSVFTRFHPLLSNASLVPPHTDGDGGLGVVLSGTTVSVDLSHGPEAARTHYGRDLRRQINVARREGVTTAVDRDWLHLPAFVALYDQTMRRNRAHSSYFHSEGDFRRLRAELGERLHLLVTRQGDVVVAAGLFTESRGVAQWYLVGADDAHAALSPTKVLVDDAVSWAAARGDTVLHLGGGRASRADSLLAFKTRFSRRRHAFHTGRWILERDTYRQLVALSNASPLTDAIDTSYFPAYRSRSFDVPAPSMGHPADGGRLRIRVVGEDDASELARLLPLIDQTYFRPHPMTPEYARALATRRGRDVYLIGFVDREPVAYGMLRGWDEGYDVPSLGVAVRADMGHRGYGREMMLALHRCARERGANSVRLRVHPMNRFAVRLYRSLGYAAVDSERGEIVMTREV